MTTYAIRITAKGIDFHFHTHSVSQLRELFEETYRMGHLGGITIWADGTELSNSEQAILAFGKLPYNA
jgi:hypothetical protein